MKPFPILLLAVSTLALNCGVSSMAAEPETSTPPVQGYAPGLGEFMSTIQLRHAKLWFAGKGKNWQLASYELDELKEAFEDAAKYQPEFKGKPITKNIEPMTAEPVERLEKAIEAKDYARFVRAYDSLSHACSACHQATDHGFISIQRPTFPPLTNQRFGLGRQP